MAVLRTHGERTAALAADLLRAQFADVRVLSIVPFADAVRECFRIAIEADVRWLITVDGDVLVSPNASKAVTQMANALPADYWQAIGYVEDKLAGHARLGGVRLYRASRLAEMLPKVRGDVLRPEAQLCLDDQRWLRCHAVTGQHDFEQYYRDLHHKGAAHRIKHGSWEKTVVARWRRSRDPDHQAALAGWDGLPLPAHLKEKAPL